MDKLELIYAYTRSQAIADGHLVDVSKVAAEAGFTIPVAITCAVFDTYVAVPDGVTCQNAQGRLWDILFMLRSVIAARARVKDNPGSELLFQLYVRNTNRRPHLVELKSVCGPGDKGEPVITIMYPDED